MPFIGWGDQICSRNSDIKRDLIQRMVTKREWERILNGNVISKDMSTNPREDNYLLSLTG